MEAARVIRSLGPVAALAMLAGCASAGGSGSSALGNYRRDFGRQVVSTLEQGIETVWSKHNYHLQRQARESSSVYYESQWRPWQLSDRTALGNPTDSRIRIILRGRRVGEGIDGVGVYHIYFEGEQQVRGGQTPDWRPIAVTPAANEEFARVAGDLELEIRAGVRR